MTNRTVKVDLVAGTTAYDAPLKESAKTTALLTLAQKEAAAAAKQLAVDEVASAQAIAVAEKAAAAEVKAAAAESVASAQAVAVADKQAALAAKEAALEEAAGAEAISAAKKEAAAASKDLAAQEKLSGQAIKAANAEASASAKEAAAQVTASAKAVAAAQREAVTAAKEVTTAQKAVATAEAESAKAAQVAAAKRTEAYKNTGHAMTLMGAGLVAAFAIAEKADTDFENSMSGIKAVAFTASDSAAQIATSMDQLRAAALQAGKDTAFTATEAANAEAELVKAGVQVSDILNGGLKGALSLAAAGQLSLADAATIAANAMNTFGLKGQDVGHIADVLASGANKSAADVQQLAYGLQQGGLVAAQTGLTLEDTTAILSAFADRGLEGADAGTSLKTMLEKLNAPTKQAADLMQNLGITAYDTTGKFVGVKDLAGQLQDKLGGLTDQQRNSALATIFGSDAIRGASVLYTIGAQGVQGYHDALMEQGAAANMAATQMDNLSGDLKQLKGSLDVALIQGGSGANGVLRDMAQQATGVVNAFASLPKWVQEAAVGFAGGAGTALLMVGGLTSLASKAASTSKGLAQVAETAEGMKGALASAGSFITGPWGLAIVGAGAVALLFAGHLHDAKISLDDLTGSIKEDGNAIGDHTTAAVANELATKGLYTAYQNLGVSQDTVTKAALGNADAMKQVVAATGKALTAAKSPEAIAAASTTLDTLQAISGGLHSQLSAQQQATAATQTATAASTAQADAQKAQAQSAQNAAEGNSQNAGAVRALFDAQTAATDIVKTDVEVTKSSTSTTKDSTGAKNAATSATKAQEAATKAATTAQTAAGTEAGKLGKATNDAATAAKSAAAAAQADASATATAAEKKKADTQATTDATTANRAAAAASTADATAQKDQATAADKAAAANDKAAKSADAKAKSAQGSQKAAADEATAQQAAADAAADAAFEHEIGATALKAWAAAASDTKHSTDALDDSVTAEVAAMKDAKDKANGLHDALDALNGVHIAAGKAAIDVQDKVASLTKTLRDNGTTLDITTDKGRANMGAVYDLTAAINSHAQAVVDETGSVAAGNDALKSSRDEFDKVLTHAGLSKDAIKNFNDTLLAIPKTVTVPIGADNSQALKALQEVYDKGHNLLYIQVAGGARAMATGGLVTGPGTETSDSVPVMASRNEFILNAAAARAIGVSNLTRWNAASGAATTVVKPQFIGQVGGTIPQAAATTAGTALRIEHYHENGGSPQQTAADLAWLMRARGAAA